MPVYLPGFGLGTPAPYEHNSSIALLGLLGDEGAGLKVSWFRFHVNDSSPYSCHAQSHQKPGPGRAG